MRILEIIQSLASGGAERLVVDLCNEMANTQDVYLLILKEVNHFYLPQVSEKVHVIQAHIPVGKNPKQFFICYQLINRIKPDIVHYHSHARYTILPANVFLCNRYKFYMTIHSDVNDGYKRGISRLQVLLSGYLGKTKFITISPTNYQQFKESYPHFDQVMIRNGRALPLFNDSHTVKSEIDSYKNDNNTIVFVHVARCAEVKNQTLLINAFNSIINKGYNAILLIIGAGYESGLGDNLKSLACTNIHFLGVRENVYDYLKYSDCFVLSSLVEGMPMSIIEALLSGIPVISTPVCGAIDAIDNDINGLICPDFSLENYIRVIEDGIIMIDKLKENARIRSINSPWGIKFCVEQYLSWFKK